MNENLMEAVDTEADSTQTLNSEADNVADSEPPSARPEGLPDKFWDAENEEVRADAMTKSYLELERRFGSENDANAPDGPEGYELDMPHDMSEATEEINAHLHAAGLSNDQAQTVYDLATEHLGQVINHYVSKAHAGSQVDRLVEHFGGEEKWQEIARQLGQWGNKKYPPEAFESLVSSYDGVLSLHKMMCAEESDPELGGGGQTPNGALSEAGIKEMMRDPRYWRDQDPVFVNKVKEGFNRLYPSEG